MLMMFVLIWATLLFSVRDGSADTGASAWGRQHCVGRYCVTLSERELTAEAGLCVVIPCSFTNADDFTPKHIVWHKCEASPTKCSDDKIIFHSNKNTDKKAQPGFEGRVSRLEPDVSQKNCSIIINDLKESDSGSYQLRVTGVRNGKQDAFSFSQRVTVSVKGLNQKPTVMIPTLTEGQQATLTCTAPGLCSGSVPEITWTWRGAGGTESYITGNSTDFKTENLTDVTQRHISTLTFNPSAEHHNTNVTCKIHFTGETTTEKTSGLNVNWFSNIQNGSGCVLQSEVLTCVCISEGFPLPDIKWPILKIHTEYLITTTVFNHTVNSTVSLPSKNYGNSTVECVSNNGQGKKRENLLIRKSFPEKHVTSTEVVEHKEMSGNLSVKLLVSIAAVSILVNIIFIIYFVLFWNSRKKMKPKEEEQTYMSLQKTDGLSEYDVICQSLN